MVKLALLSFYSPHYQPVADLVLPDRDEYCRRHGYEHVVKVGPYLDRPWYYGYDSKAFIYDMFWNPAAVGLTESPDIIWFPYLPCVLTNLNKPITDILTPEHDFWMNKDCHAVNLGSFVVRKSEWSKRWLLFIMNNEAQYRYHCWKDLQCVIEHWQDPEWKEKICVVPQNQLGSYIYSYYPPWNSSTPGEWRPGDLALSLPGMDLGKRLGIIASKEMQDRIIR